MGITVRHLLALALSTCLVIASARPAQADEGPSTEEVEAPARPRARAPRRTPVPDHAIPMAVVGGLTLAGGMALYTWLPGMTHGESNRWRGGIFMDESARSTLRAAGPGGQAIAMTISDIALVTTMLKAQVLDSLVVPLAQDDPDLAWQASFAHTLALGLTLGAGEIVKSAVGRARPFERECATNPQAEGCDDEDRFASFYSLHTGMAFTSAGFSCAMHLSRRLYDDPAADIASCGASVALAATTGMLRIVSDRHYMTDVLVGAVLGFLVGYVVPLAIIPNRPRQTGGPETMQLDPRDEPDPIPATPGLTWQIQPMMTAPGSALLPELDAADGTARPSIGPDTRGRASASGLGGTLGIGISGTF